MTDPEAILAAAGRIQDRANKALDDADEALSAAKDAREKVRVDVEEAQVLISQVSDGAIPIEWLARVMAEVNATPEAAPVQPERKARIRQNERGSAAWNAGRVARDEQGPIAKSPYHPESTAFKGWLGGYDERSAELAALGYPAHLTGLPIAADAVPLNGGDAFRAAIIANLNPYPIETERAEHERWLREYMDAQREAAVTVVPNP